MSESCLLCFQPLTGSPRGEYHRACAERLFGTARIPRLEVDPENLHLMGIQMAGRVSLSGVQKKLALELEKGSLHVVTSGGGGYILKPQAEEYPCLPENEQLCMRLARAVGLRTAETGLIRMLDGRLAFLARRFDRDDGRRLPMEDFCQLTEKLPRDKYSGSYEQVAKTIRRYSDEWIVDGAELLRQILFSWWVGNNDLHLKNISLLGTEGRHQLSPCYDLVSTRILGLKDELALTIGGRHSNVRHEDWLELASRLGMTERATEREIRRLVDGARDAIVLTTRAPLREDLVAKLLGHFGERLSGLIELWAAAIAQMKRPQKKIAAAVEPACESASRVAGTIRDVLIESDVDPGETLEQQLRELEWMGRFSGSVFSESGPWREDQGRTSSAFLAFIRMARIAHALEAGSRLSGVSQVLKHVAKLECDPDGLVPEQPGDRLYELEIAAAIVKVDHLRVELGETDIVILDPEGPRWGIECKRPRKESTVARNLRQAIGQLKKREIAGFVVISLDAMVDRRWILSDDRQDGLEEAQRQMASLINSASKVLDQEFPEATEADTVAAGTALGAVFTLDVVVMSRAENAGGWIYRSHTLTRVKPNPYLPRMTALVEFLANNIAVGSAELSRGA